MSASTPRRHRWLLHIDLDQFQVAVERLRSPELVGAAVIVGGNGDPTEARKVVTCASYEARAVGVRAGMPLRTAYRKMPDAVYLPLDMSAYDAASAQVMETLRQMGHPLEVWGWDEAYAGIGDVSGSDISSGDSEPGDHEPGDDEILALASDIRDRVAAECGLACRIGISDNKQRAKMATGFAKRGIRDAGLDRVMPPGVFLLDKRNWLPLMGSAPTGDLWSVGPRTADKLAAMGVATVEQLIATDKDDLIARFGPHQGNWLYVLCRGGGDATITVEPFEAKSHSKSHTFATDLTEPAEIAAAATDLTDELLGEIVAEGRTPFRVAVTVRTATFYTRTKSRKLAAPTTDRDTIVAAVNEVLAKFEQGRPVRLLGVRLDLVDTDTATDTDEDDEHDE
ncbi:DNA polymerase IV [Gordonia sp. VNK1]|uniref:DNA polymerase IV n=1 Tax=Gordonia oleivorans TaxID=3156618 RepID=UPI0032B46BD7